MLPLSTVKTGYLNFDPTGTSSKQKLSEEGLNYKEACQNERGEGSTPQEEEWTSSGQGSGEQSGGGKKDVKALEKKEKDQAFTSGGVIKEEKRLSKGIWAFDYTYPLLWLPQGHENVVVIEPYLINVMKIIFRYRLKK